MIAKQHLNARLIEWTHKFGQISPRIPLLESVDQNRGKQTVTIKVQDVERVVFGTENIDLGAVEQIVEAGQL